MTSSRSVIAVSLPPEASRARYALGVLLDLLELRAREPADGELPHLGYGSTPARCSIPAGAADHWDDPRPALTRVGALPVIHRPGRPPAPGVLGFDVLYATYACLTAPWERADPVDEAGCPVAEQGWLARHDVLEEPLVHHYARCLADALRRTGLDVASPPPATVVLTHDVDNNWGHVFGRRESWELLQRDVRSRSPAAVRRAAGLARRVLTRRADDPNDRFDDWAAWHAGWHSRPAFFVSSYGLFRRGADRRDVPYDVRNAEVRRVLRRTVTEGAEIGIHFSLLARRSAERLQAEREALEEALDVPVRSSRHHWWALGVPAEPTLAAHAQAGVTVDCSLGFNDRPGFRRGIAAPFRPFDATTGRTLDVWALPTVAMDASLYGRLEPEGALTQLRALYARARDVGGALVLDWHVHAANARAMPHAADGLRRLIGEALADGAVARTPLEVADAASARVRDA